MIIFIGPQGSGKGTQADILASEYRATHLSTGEMLRNSADPAVHRKLESGQLFDDKDMTEVLKESMDKLLPRTKIILDGYPRNLQQKRLLEELLGKRAERVEQVIYLSLPREESFARMRLRGRADDTDGAIEHRLAQYEAETTPLIDEYRLENLLVEVDGLGSVEQVANRIKGVVPWHT
jgi:adenylate kinase